MFTYFFSLVIIIFEAICCNLFYDVFCKENSRLRKSQKVLLMLSLICCYYLCGLFLSDMLILKMTLVVLAAVIIMSFYFEISIKKSVIFALLYQGLSIIVDYIAYISNNTIISKRNGKRIKHQLYEWDSSSPTSSVRQAILVSSLK